LASKASINDDDKKNNAVNDSKKPIKFTAPNDSAFAPTKKIYVKKRKAAGTNSTTKSAIKKTSQKMTKAAAAKAAAAAAAVAATALPMSISPESLITKPAKSSAGSGLVRSISPASLTKVPSVSASLPSPPSSASSPQLSVTGSSIDDTESMDLLNPLASATAICTPPLEDWATQTADEILAASAADEFFWLSNDDSGDDTVAPTTGRHESTTSTSLSLSFDSADVDMESIVDVDIDFDDVYQFDDMRGDTDESFGAKYAKQPAADAFEPFCDFDFSIDAPISGSITGISGTGVSSASAALSATAVGAGAGTDPYGFLDLGITI
jgi:hypothetical protein